MESIGGKTAFVTGAGRNIGRAIAVELARRGCNVVINGRSDRASCEAAADAARQSGPGIETLVVTGDVGDAGAVREMTAAALDRFGTVDIVVNNAGVRPLTPFLDSDEEDWQRLLGVNLLAAFRTCRAFLPGMVDKGWGRIVNVTGLNAINGYPGRAPVSAAKHGLWGLTKALAKEFGPHGVTVNAISPGPIRTEHDDPEVTRRIEQRLSQVPLGRLGEPEDIAALAGFLCSNEGGFVNGQMIGSNGGAQT